MEIPSLEITGGRSLWGHVRISGFKHSTVPILACSVLGKNKIILHDVPRVKDTFALIELMSRTYGSQIELHGTDVYIDNSNISKQELFDYELAGMIHGSAYLIPAIAVRLRKAKMYKSGGCKIGSSYSDRRPVGHMMDVIKRFGAVVNEQGIKVESLKGTEIDIAKYDPYMTSGATKIGIMYANVADGETLLKNCYMGQEVLDLIGYFKSAGADIKYNKRNIMINGPTKFGDAEFTVSKDLIEIMTFIVASGITKSEICIDVRLEDIAYGLKKELKYLNEAGFQFEKGKGYFKVKPPEQIKSINVESDANTGGYSDNQSLFAALALYADGESTIEDKVWCKRNGYVVPFMRLGASINMQEDKIIINPPKKLYSDKVLESCDLRVAAANIIAALGIEGKTNITQYYHIGRGYHDLTGKLNRLGASIEEMVI